MTSDDFVSSAISQVWEKDYGQDGAGVLSDDEDSFVELVCRHVIHHVISELGIVSRHGLCLGLSCHERACDVGVSDVEVSAVVVSAVVETAVCGHVTTFSHAISCLRI